MAAAAELVSDHAPAPVRATRAHAACCFSALSRALSVPVPEAAHTPSPPGEAFDKRAETPFFVTLKKRTRHGYELRGCIGTLSPRRHSQIPDYALKSAFEDSRFSPVEAGELPLLQVGVSLLVEYEPAASPYDWEVGKHGIIIDFRVDGRSYSATYLPDVAPEQGWTQAEAIASLIRKAGYRGGALSAAAMAAMKVTRYQSSKYELAYQDWKAGMG